MILNCNCNIKYALGSLYFNIQVESMQAHVEFMKILNLKLDLMLLY